MQRRVVVLACAALIAACGSKEKQANKNKAPVEDAEPGPTGPRTPEPVTAVVPTVDTGEVAELVNTWLKAQNDRDIVAYEALYAQRFTGTVRDGPRVSSYDRASWIADRRRKFKKKMAVSITAMRISTSSKIAVVDLDGQRQLVVVSNGDALEISREQVWLGSVAGADGELEPLPREKFGFVISEAGAYFVISRRPVKTKDVPPTPISRGSPAIATKPADLDALDPALREWQGRSVALYRPEGDPCETTVQELLVLTGFEPHHATVEQWETFTLAEVAQDIWQGATDDARMLVGRVGDDCMGTLWGGENDKTPVPRSQQSRDEVTDFDAVALAHFRSLKGYAMIQKDYGSKLPWDMDSSMPRVAVFRDSASGSDYVAVEAVAGTGCGKFYGEFWALFRVDDRDGKRELVLLTDETAPGPLFFPSAVADVDADGVVEFISPTTILRRLGKTYHATETVAYPNYEAHCP